MYSLSIFKLNPFSFEIFSFFATKVKLLEIFLRLLLNPAFSILKKPPSSFLFLNKNNIDTIQFVQFGSENINLEKDKVDAIWSFGAMHHMIKKNQAFENYSRILKPNGRIVIGDVFLGSNLAKHFDNKVARYCITGHEVAFWSKEYTESICFLNGFKKPKFYDLNIQWRFRKKEDIGTFLYKLHGMTKTTPKDCLKGAEEILGIEKKNGFYCLNWPITIFIITNK